MWPQTLCCLNEEMLVVFHKIDFSKGIMLLHEYTMIPLNCPFDKNIFLILLGIIEKEKLMGIISAHLRDITRDDTVVG